MGFLGALFGGVVSLATKLVGGAVKAVGTILRSEAIKDAGTAISSLFSFGESSYDDSSTSEDTVDVHAELNLIVKDVEMLAEKNENEIIDTCIQEVGEALHQLMKIMQSSELQNLEETYAEEIREKSKGKLLKAIQKKLSLDDATCASILTIRDKRQRKAEAEEYKNKVFTQTLEAFKKNCMRLKNNYCKKIVSIAQKELANARSEFETQQNLLAQRESTHGDEIAIDLEREEILIEREKLLLVQALARQE